jgi:DNA-binding MurR/RpiR family transcriptional regulator
MANPGKVIFMTTKELSEACDVSEATVVRFVGQLGFGGYSEFLQSLRDIMDTELTLLDRFDLTDLRGPGAERFQRVVLEEIENLKHLLRTMDLEAIDQVVQYLHRSRTIYIVGSRLSYTTAYYLGWSLTKIRSNVHILKGSDSTAVDWLTIAPAESLVVMIATTRYPNELLRLGKLVRRLHHTLVVFTDSTTCPLIQFAHQALIAPPRNIPFIGSPTTLSCLCNYVIQALASRQGQRLKDHQRRLEQTYRENDILFNIHPPGDIQG